MDLPTNGGLRVSLETALSADGSVLPAAVSPVGVRSLTSETVQPCADSVGHSRLAQCRHRYSSPFWLAR